MSYLIYLPVNKSSTVLTTTQPIFNQLWQEFKLLRLLSNNQHIDYIDQSFYYSKDALVSHWRSAGLLHYYSFLNLAKAFIVEKSINTPENIKSAKHGITMPQDQLVENEIMNSSIRIINDEEGKINIFTSIYKLLTGKEWPFKQNITIKIKDIFPSMMCTENENKELFSIPHKIGIFQSLLRFNDTDNSCFFELAVSNNMTNDFNFLLSDHKWTKPNLNRADKYEWLVALRLNSVSLRDYTMFRTPVFSNSKILNENRINTMKFVSECLDGYVFSNYCYKSEEPSCVYLPKVLINKLTIFWHPILSDYLFSFCIGSLLRYKPELFNTDKKFTFLAEAWNNQAPIAVLRVLLMEFTNPSIIIKSVD